MSDQKGTTVQRGYGVASGISEELNCGNRSVTGGCGKYGHSLDHHTLVNGSLLCGYCGATCATKPYPKQLHVVPASAEVFEEVEKEVEVKGEKVLRKVRQGTGTYKCPFCGVVAAPSNIAECASYNLGPHVGCHLWSKW